MRYVLFGAIVVAAGTSLWAADAPHETAAEIDRLFQVAWEREQVTPADTADDAEYLRRLYLDLAGRIPAVSEVRDFLDDESKDKRSHAVELLLDSPSSVRHFTTALRNALIPQANSQPQFRALIPGFEAWLWQHISEGRPYDQIVHDIITTELNTNAGAALSSTTSPDAFFLVRELKPENLASGTARAFLGVRLDCAQCHDHPFDKWSQDQFWNMAAFYSGFSRPDDDDADNPAMMQDMTEKTDARTINIPGTENVVPAVYLTGLEPDWTDDSKTPRQMLADWVVDSENPYFAKMAVNRLWAQFFGRGIVDPVDDFSDGNPPSHPQVLDLLAQEFVSSGFDVNHVVRVITATNVYQLSGRQTHASQAEPSHFARAALRGLTPEQFFDSVAEAVGYYQPYRSDNPFVVDMNSPRARFLDLFRNNVESPLERETTILQALAMMNGDFIDNATSVDDSQTLRAIAEFPGMSDEQKLETLFLAALSRRPSANEQRRFGEYLSSGGAAKNSRAALSDIFWALLNSSEFLLNH
ncbi:MAG TPA: DUF1553 domain-containing protein [Planctomycetes bacterium]|nr:DUF1553 domain-containing protein [Fuerstiella sp.]HIK95975.1 DUF1553 domain-containing protein [Planctomycetota bacterium]